MPVYLTAVIIGLPVVGLAFVLAGGQRRVMLIAGLGLAALSPLSMLYENRYWTADRIFGGGWGIEDALFGFSFGSVVWLVAVWPARATCPSLMKVTVRQALLRAIAPIAAGLATLAAARGAGIGFGMAAIAGHCAALAYLLIRRPDLLSLLARPLLVYVPYYFAVVGLTTAIHPAFPGFWAGGEFVGTAFFGLPVEEFLWMATAAMLYPAFVAHALDLHPLRRARQQRHGPASDHQAGDHQQGPRRREALP
ncbi:MAG: hypothetical protein R3D02_07645 [Hyphomicrobiales bacterium]